MSAYGTLYTSSLGKGIVSVFVFLTPFDDRGSLSELSAKIQVVHLQVLWLVWNGVSDGRWLRATEVALSSLWQCHLLSLLYCRRYKDLQCVPEGAQESDVANEGDAVNAF
eukprot:m.163416 g.163416  ORF g.163416 m.163416 type:complete len:110 (+) comp38852_c0_seq27:255-584(+)